MKVTTHRSNQEYTEKQMNKMIDLSNSQDRSLVGVIKSVELNMSQGLSFKQALAQVRKDK